MAKLHVITLICALGANFTVIILIFKHFILAWFVLFFFFSFSTHQPWIQANSFSSGALGKLYFGALTNKGLVGHLLMAASQRVNNVSCLTLGPDFLNRCSKYNGCPKGSFAPNAFQSYEEFCECYRNADPQLQDCLSITVVDSRMNVKGFTDITIRIGECCYTGEVRIFFLSLQIIFI